MHLGIILSGSDILVIEVTRHLETCLEDLL